MTSVTDVSTLLEMTPLDRTQNLQDISVTERGQFRTCRRRWQLQTIDNWEPKSPAWALKFGTGIHSALEALYSLPERASQKTKLAAMTEAFDEWHAETKAELDDDPDALASDKDELHEYAQLGIGMIENYLAYDAKAKAKIGKVLLVEGFAKNAAAAKRFTGGNDRYPAEAQPVIDLEAGRILVPIVDPETLMPFEGVPCLTMKIDLVTERDTPRKGLWVVDHKTSAQAYSDRGLDFDDQATGYCYGLWRLAGIIPRGVMFNILIKELTKPPRVSESTGKLSTAKDQLCTADDYREALKEHGHLVRGKITSEKHAECLDALLARGWKPFFQRLEPTRNQHELLSFERRLAAEYLDMTEAHEIEAMRYPNPSVRTCSYCPVNKICQAMEDGSDVEQVLTQFRQAEDRKAA